MFLDCLLSELLPAKPSEKNVFRILNFNEQIKLFFHLPPELLPVSGLCILLFATLARRSPAICISAGTAWGVYIDRVSYFSPITKRIYTMEGSLVDTRAY